MRFLVVLLALTTAPAVWAQTAPLCPDFEGYGPPGSLTDAVDAMSAPLPAFLERIARCEVGFDAATTALLRARFSDDPTLRPVLRRIVDALRLEALDRTADALLALAVLGERPGYFADQAEVFLADGDEYLAQNAVRISSFYADSILYKRFEGIQARYPQHELVLGEYWNVSGTGANEYNVNAVDLFLRGPLSVDVEDAVLSIRGLGFRAYGLGEGIVTVSSISDTWTAANVYMTVVFRRLGAADPARVRSAIEASPAFRALDAEFNEPAFTATYRRILLSAALPGESFTSDTFPPPTDRSLLTVRPMCAGRPATVYVEAGRVVGGPLAGTLFAGRLLGTAAADVIVGTDAADALLGLDGNDTLCGGTGDDALDAGTGTDTADGGAGTDGCDAAETATACEGAIPALTDVRPVLECVAPAAGGGFTAYFGYENQTTRAGRVAYSANNRITPAAFDRSQPDLFGRPGVVAGRPGRSPFYPGHAFTVTFQPGQTVVWKLFTRTSTASSGSARCPAP